MGTGAGGASAGALADKVVDLTGPDASEPGAPAIVVAEPGECAAAAASIRAAAPALGASGVGEGSLRVQARFEDLWDGLSTGGAVPLSAEAAVLGSSRAGAPVPKRATGRFASGSTIEECFAWIDALLLDAGFGTKRAGGVRSAESSVPMDSGSGGDGPAGGAAAAVAVPAYTIELGARSGKVLRKGEVKADASMSELGMANCPLLVRFA